jgi:hypothetical protein
MRLVVLLFAFASSASAASVTFTPALPREGERVTAIVQGYSSCGGVRDLSVRVEGRTIYLHGRTYGCHGLVPYTASITFDAPAAGVYGVEYSTTFAVTSEIFETENRLVVRGATCDFAESLSANARYLPLGDPLRLEWCDAGDATYRVYHARTARGPFSLVAETGGTSYQATPAAAGDEYYFVEARQPDVATRTATVRTTVTGSPCGDTPTSLCLGGRFVLSSAWSHGIGGLVFSGYGRAQRLTNDSAAFWFFDRDNIDITVKVINACDSPLPRYWVFVSGMTNVGVHVSVSDTKRLVSKTYVSPDGATFATVLDTNAFATCP